MAISTASENSTSRAHPNRSLELATAAAQSAHDNRGQDIRILDLRQQTPMFDYFVIATVRQPPATARDERRNRPQA